MKKLTDPIAPLMPPAEQQRLLEENAALRAFAQKTVKTVAETPCKCLGDGSVWKCARCVVLRDAARLGVQP